MRVPTATRTAPEQGSTTVDNMVLAGNHFGTRVLDNHLLGGRWAFRVRARVF